MGHNQNTIAANNHQQVIRLKFRHSLKKTGRCREINLAVGDALQWPLSL